MAARGVRYPRTRRLEGLVGEEAAVGRFTIRTLAVGAAVVGGVVLLTTDTARRAARRAGSNVERRVRYLRGVAEGAAYRIRGRRPDPDVSDDILTQRVRSALGGLEKRRDLPHVHVMVADQLVLLHGELPTAEDVREIERRVLEVSGVRSIESYLHVGLTRGTTRPSAGYAAQAAQPSAALRALLGAARDAGASEENTALAVRGVLGAFTDRIPDDEREQLLSHLPVDARELAGPPRRGGAPSRLRTVPELVASVTARGDIDPERAGAITEAVLGRLRTLVPEEAADVSAVLPDDLRALWSNAAPA